MRRPGERGFSLLEILVAFSILALTLGVLMQIFSGSLRNAEMAHDQAQAVALAQSLLAAAGIETPLTAGETSGQAGNKFRWLLQAQLFHEEPQTAVVAPATGASPRLELWEVKVEIHWGGDSATTRRSFSLSSLRLQMPPAP